MICLNCSNDTSNVKFCNSSCAATYNNKHFPKRKRKKIEFRCEVCEIIIPYTVNNKKYCSVGCNGKALQEKKYSDIKNGFIGASRRTYKQYLVKLYGTRCFTCGLTEWNAKPIPIELDHIDGNASNNELINLRLLCPNCHAQTPTWKGANKGNGRGYRGLPLG